VRLSNRDTLQIFEDTGAWTRLGKGGHTLIQATGIVVASFLHTLSRGKHDDGLPDMNIHIHNCCFTPCSIPGGGFRAMLGITVRATAPKKDYRASRSALYELKMTMGAVFQESLACRIEALGYDLTRTKNGFDVVGVPKELAEHFSTRRRQIVADMQSRGVTGAREAAYSAKSTRPAKAKLSSEELFSRWQEVAKARGFDPTSLRVRAPRPVDEVALQAHLRTHIDTIAAVAEAKSKGQVAANHSTERKVPPSKDKITTRSLDQPGREPGRRAASQIDNVHALSAAATIGRVLAHARRGASPRVTRAQLWLAVKTAEYLHRTHFSIEEKRALLDITRARRGSIQYLSGAAGERIAPILRIAAKGWSSLGYRVLLATPSKASAERFEKETGIHSISIAGLDRGMRTNRGLLRGADAAFGKALGNPPGFNSKQSFVNYLLESAGRFIRLDKKCVVVIHEADVLPLPERAALLRRVTASGARVVFVDDSRHVSAIASALQRESPTRQERTQAHRENHEEEVRAERERTRTS
jgi:hypothetical protein